MNPVESLRRARVRRLMGALLVGVACAGSATPAAAQTLRWSSQGDPLTMDPHSQNELLTNNFTGQIYEPLVGRDRSLAIVPVLATSWQQVSPTLWRFKLRPNVKFHDGTPFTADDVVFSVQRARDGVSDLKTYALALGELKVVDALTIDFVLPQVNPVFLEHLYTVQIMSRAWAGKHGASRPIDFKTQSTGYASLNANGTGPYRLVLREPDVKTVYRRNPTWWGRLEGNVQEVVYTPIKSDATRVAALISGELDFVLDPSPQDLTRLRKTDGLKLIQGTENRIIFIGMDQSRDELLYSSVKGKNPFKDVRVRRALYQAIDIETLRSRLMRGQALPTGGMTPSPRGAFNDPAIEQRLPFDLAAARELMSDAGYPQGFEVALDCPNNRYINDEEICQTLAAMWAKLGVRVRLNAMPRSIFFPRLHRLDTSLYLMGWGGASTDAEITLTPLMRSRGEGGVGGWNFGQISNARLDEAAVASSREADPARREQLIKTALREQQAAVNYIPLHRQVISWAARQDVDVVQRADNWVEFAWIRMK